MEKVKKSHLELGKEYFKEGVKYSNQSELNKAIAEFDKAIAEYNKYKEMIAPWGLSHNDLAETHFWLGRTYYECHKTTVSIDNYNKSIKEYETSSNYLMFEDRDVSDSELKFKHFAKVYFHIGVSYDRILDYEKSITSYSLSIDNYDELKELKDQINLAEAYYKRGNCYRNLEKYPEAIEDYDQVISCYQTINNYKSNSEIARKLPFVYYVRGIVYRDITDYKMAVSEFTEAITILGDIILIHDDIEDQNLFSEMHYHRACAYHKWKKHAEAIADYTVTIEKPSKRLEVEIVDCYNGRGACHFHLNNYSDAIADFTEVLKYEPERFRQNLDDIAKAYNYRAQTYGVSGNTNAAIKDYRAEILIWINLSDKMPLRGCLRIGELLIKENKYKAAMASFKEYNGSFMDVLISCPRPKDASKLKLRKAVLYSFVDNDKFLTDTLKGIDKNVDLYKDIYIQSLELVEILHIKDLSSNRLHKQPEPEVAHYTTKIASEKMLFKKDNKEASPIRLASVATSNDPQEGLSLLACLGLSNDNIESDHEAFITCFTFNHDCLNQFRLYGKENNKEATGISLVIDRNYFKSYLDELPASAKIKSKEKKIPEVIESKGDLSNLEQEIINLKQEVVNLKQTLTPKQDPPRVPDKLSLYRCVYIDPETGQVVSVGHRESYTFYRESPTWERDKVKKYEDEIAEIVEKFSVGFGNLKKEVDKLKKAIVKENKETQIVHEGILSKLLLHLRYLVKHVAFKEEQECRMITVEPLKRNPKIKVEDDKRMFIEHLPLASSVRHVYFAPNAPGYKLFQDRIKFEGLQFDCRISKSPLAKE